MGPPRAWARPAADDPGTNRSLSVERRHRRDSPAGGIPAGHAETGVLGNNLWPVPRRPAPPARHRQYAAVGRHRRGVSQGNPLARSAAVAATRAPCAGPGWMDAGVSCSLSALLHPGSQPARQLTRWTVADAVYDLAVVGAGVMGQFTADFARRRGATVLLLDQWRIGDPRAASFSLTRSIRNDYMDPVYARLAFEARQLWLDFQRQTGESI